MNIQVKIEVLKVENNKNMKNKNERHNWYNGLNIRAHKSAIIDNVKHIIQSKLLNPRKFINQ